MIGQTKSGVVVENEVSVHVVLWTPAKTEEGLRYSIFMNLINQKLCFIYEKYLTDVITPKSLLEQILVHGHTDVIGEEDHNRFIARANDEKYN
jgi:hypothetical protein